MDSDTRATLSEARQIEKFVRSIPESVICILAHLKGMDGGRGRAISEDVIKLLLEAYPVTPLNSEYLKLIREKPELLSAFAECITDLLEKAGGQINSINKPCIVTVTDTGPAWKLDLLPILNALAAKNPYWAESLGKLVVEKA